jgi:hypothetical protein
MYVNSYVKEQHFYLYSLFTKINLLLIPFLKVKELFFQSA